MHFTMENEPTSTTLELLFQCTYVLKFQLKQQISLMTKCLTYVFGTVVQFYYCKCVYPIFSNDNRVRLAKSTPSKKSDLKEQFFHVTANISTLDFQKVPQNQNDNILVDKTSYSNMINIQPYRGVDVNEDRCLVITKKVENWSSGSH